MSLLSSKTLFIKAVKVVSKNWGFAIIETPDTEGARHIYVLKEFLNIKGTIFKLNFQYLNLYVDTIYIEVLVPIGDNI